MQINSVSIINKRIQASLVSILMQINEGVLMQDGEQSKYSKIIELIRSDNLGIAGLHLTCAIVYPKLDAKLFDLQKILYYQLCIFQRESFIREMIMEACYAIGIEINHNKILTSFLERSHVGVCFSQTDKDEGLF